MSFAVGEVVLNRYEIRREVGRGGFSIVYLAHDRVLFREVALKLLVPPPASAQVARERLRREVLAAQDLSHSHIVPVYDFIEPGDRSAIVMQYVAGADLSVRVADRGPLSPEQTARVGRDIAAALSVAHRHGVLHRDVKPSNILLDQDGEARLTDFGSAKLDGLSTVTGTGGLIGTLDYLAPEVLAGHRGDARADIYALGMTLYFVLTGRLPERPSPHLPPPPSPDGHRPSRWRKDTPEWLDQAVATATAALPADRFSSAALLADALSLEVTGELRVPQASHHLLFCLLCGADEPLGLGLCAGCAATAPAGQHRLLLVHRPASAGEREHTRGRLRALAGPSVPGAALDAAARGERVLAWIPTAGTERVLERLSGEGVAARAVSRWWAPLPRPIYATGAAMAAVGVMAGQFLPPLVWLSPVLAVLVLLEAQRRLQRPVFSAPARAGGLAGPVRERLALTVARLPSGTALSLLADLARNAQSVVSRLTEEQATEHQSGVEQLIHHACDAAADLAELEDILQRMERQRTRSGGRTSGSWLDAVARAERARDALVQRLLDAITALSEARLRAVESSAEDSDRLARLSDELRREVTAYAEARREVEALL